MKRMRALLYVSFLAAIILAISVIPYLNTQPTILAQNTALAQRDATLVSLRVDEAPTLDGVANEAFWGDAEAVEVELRRGANMEESVSTIKSVYTEDMVYFLVTWTDPTHSYLRFPWEMQADGSWIQLRDPEDEGGDDNLWYEDKYAFIWSINNSIVDFEYDGCFMACHSGDDSGKPYGNKFTESEGELGDIWHFKSVRNVGQLHDQYLDWTEYSEDSPEAGRHSDPSDSGGYSNNINEDKTMPAFMPAGDDFPRDGSPGFILAEEAVEFDPSVFEPGDRIPGIIVAPFVGDGGDISAGSVYADGLWTLEFGRALDTGSEYDVQFTDLTAEYYFGVAAFDNAQVRHAFQRGAVKFLFGG